MTLTRRIFLRNLGLGLVGVGVANTWPNPVWATPARSFKLPRSLPEAQGVSSAKLLDFVNAVEAKKLNLHSIMVLRHGQVVAEGWWAPYAAPNKHTLYSLSKSFTSSAIGFAVAEGKLTVDDKVVSFFPDEKPAAISANLAAMRIKDLLTMSTGHDKDTTAAIRTGTDNNWIKAFLAQPVEHQPGTFFVYNSGATYMLSAIIQKTTGQTVINYLKPRLFEPLGIEGADWEVDPNGINVGGWGLRVKTEDIAKFGQLYLQKGMWNGKRILPEAWIEEATRGQVQSKGGSRPKEENDWLQGYGYQFWRCRNDAYRGDGAYGQYCIVLPKDDAVVAITSETSDMQAVLDQVWNHILPGLRSGGQSTDKADQTQLKQKLTSLTLPLMAGLSTSPLAAQINGKAIAFEDNTLSVKTASLNFGKDGCIFTMKDSQGDHRIVCGLGRWVEGETDLSSNPLKLFPSPVPGEVKTKIAASGTWQDPNTFVMTWRFTETAHYEVVTCKFENDNCTLSFIKSVMLLTNGKDSRPVLQGKLQTALTQMK